MYVVLRQPERSFASDGCLFVLIKTGYSYKYDSLFYRDTSNTYFATRGSRCVFGVCDRRGDSSYSFGTRDDYVGISACEWVGFRIFCLSSYFQSSSPCGSWGHSRIIHGLLHCSIRREICDRKMGQIHRTLCF